ncbi:MAG: hypothetical protein Q8934_12010 [Bacillota bacterium]|nr:hypothetical protein [Bacillota bacterium]
MTGLSYCLQKDSNNRFSTVLLYGDKPLAQHNDGGELNLLIENGDRADRMEISSWKATEAIEKDGRLILKGKSRLSLFTSDLDLEVSYEQITEQVLKKQIRIYQNDIPRLYLSLRNSLEPVSAPKSYWSFDHTDHLGGPAYGILADDVFPAAGFIDNNGLMVGLLTDSGWKNKWSRHAWRRTGRGNTTAIQMADPALLRTATQLERNTGKHHVTLTLGELYGNARIPLDYQKENGNRYRFLGRQGYRYTVALEYQGNVNGESIHVCDVNGTSIHSIFYNDEYSKDSNEWVSFVDRTNELPYDGFYSFHIQESSKIQTRNIQIYESAPQPVPWHELRQGEELVYTIMIFAEECEATSRNIKLKSQMNLSDGLGFKGSEIEKILYADSKMLTWITEPGLNEPMVVPSTFYFEMYFRDVFWILNGTHDAYLNENILRRIGETMNGEGAIDNIITAYHGSIEHTDNELPYLYLIWSFLNKKRFGSKPDLKKVQQITQLIQNKFDPDGDGVIKTNNPQSAMDVMWQNRPCRFASSQGYYAVALMAAKELGMEIAEEYVQAAIDAYRDYYDEYGTDGKFLHTFPDNTLGENGTSIGMVCNLDLEPEFLSLYVFDRSMLDRQIVIDTLEKYPISPEGLMPNLCRTDGKAFTKEVNPFSGGLYWKPGIYANGGSWLREQYIVLAVGKYHGWAKADELMQKRVDAELNFDSKNPLSREYLSLTEDPDDSAVHRVFGWNIILLAIHEWLGLRKPEWDPDYSKS